MSSEPQSNLAARERVLVCGVLFPEFPTEFGGELSEISALVRAAGAEVVGVGVTQKRHTPHPATLMGKGKVEEITATYVVVKIWDWRRLVLPLSYFIEQPFQNWTRETASLIGNVIIYLDFTVPVERVRQKAHEIAKASPLWDGDVFAVQVIDFKPTVMEVRILVSARDSAEAYDLRCEVREKLIAFIQEEYPETLPRTRAELAGPNGPDITVGSRAATEPNANAPTSPVKGSG